MCPAVVPRQEQTLQLGSALIYLRLGQDSLDSGQDRRILVETLTLLSNHAEDADHAAA